jgi:hypothetical protein
MTGRVRIVWLAITAAMGGSGYLAWIGWGPLLDSAYVWLSSPAGIVIGRGRRPDREHAHPTTGHGRRRAVSMRTTITQATANLIDCTVLNRHGSPCGQPGEAGMPAGICAAHAIEVYRAVGRLIQARGKEGA